MRPRFLLLVALAVSLPSIAFAHALLASATPSVGGSVKAAPSEIAITYSEGVEPKFSTIEVRDASGVRVDTMDVHTAPNDNKRLIVGVKPLTPGVYKVIWHVTSTDTHKTQGNYSFTVSP